MPYFHPKGHIRHNWRFVDSLVRDWTPVTNSLSVSDSGPATIEATASGAFGSLTGSVTAVVTHEATVSGSYTFTGTATAVPTVEATASGTFGGLTGSASAVVTHEAVVAGAYTFSGSATAITQQEATASAAFGGMTGSATATIGIPITLLGETEAFPTTNSNVTPAIPGTAVADDLCVVVAFYSLKNVEIELYPRFRRFRAATRSSLSSRTCCSRCCLIEI